MTPADWMHSTPCDAWNLFDLVGHLACTAIDAHRTMAKAVRFHPVPVLEEDDLARQNAVDLSGLRITSSFGRVRLFEMLSRSYLSRALIEWNRSLYSYGEAIWSVGSGIGVYAVEWHVHAWDVASALGRPYRPCELDVLGVAFAEGMPYLHLPPERHDLWEAILVATGRRSPPRTAVPTSPQVPTARGSDQAAVLLPHRDR
ncbi:hypothetical protein GCM10009661_28470 [Catellatospora chokoriensis]|uniref:Mycothiol-dependent maleylpyruvate isomerase metal-binding domain-containing protein n=1 Tax=Catellatospora chokoriensis TaxID=310353 RepID=A0A8J3KBX9_9ACTN|nr:hypothetical protein Cch02nite_78390 [Catellatospora chokoriensis]